MDQRLKTSIKFLSSDWRKPTNFMPLSKSRGWMKTKYGYNVKLWQFFCGPNSFLLQCRTVVCRRSGYAAAPEFRAKRRNRSWEHLNNFDIISMPDKWEYPWYAGWDLAFPVYRWPWLTPISVSGNWRWWPVSGICTPTASCLRMNGALAMSIRWFMPGLPGELTRSTPNRGDRLIIPFWRAFSTNCF